MHRPAKDSRNLPMVSYVCLIVAPRKVERASVDGADHNILPLVSRLSHRVQALLLLYLQEAVSIPIKPERRTGTEKWYDAESEVSTRQGPFHTDQAMLANSELLPFKLEVGSQPSASRGKVCRLHSINRAHAWGSDRIRSTGNLDPPW